MKQDNFFFQPRLYPCCVVTLFLSKFFIFFSFKIHSNSFIVIEWKRWEFCWWNISLQPKGEFRLTLVKTFDCRKCRVYVQSVCTSSKLRSLLDSTAPTFLHTFRNVRRMTANGAESEQAFETEAGATFRTCFSFPPYIPATVSVS